jgi:hypothetical protein
LIEYPSLKELVAREQARRAEANTVYMPFSFIVDDKGENAFKDVAEAVKAIEAERGTRANGSGSSQKVCIHSAINDAVCAALEAGHPRQFARLGGGPNIIARVVVHPGAPLPAGPWRGTMADMPTTGRLVAPDTPAYDARDDDAVARAAHRIANLRAR